MIIAAACILPITWLIHYNINSWRERTPYTLSLQRMHHCIACQNPIIWQKHGSAMKKLKKKTTKHITTSFVWCTRNVQWCSVTHGVHKVERKRKCIVEIEIPLDNCSDKFYRDDIHAHFFVVVQFGLFSSCWQFWALRNSNLMNKKIWVSHIVQCDRSCITYFRRSISILRLSCVRLYNVNVHIRYTMSFCTTCTLLCVCVRDADMHTIEHGGSQAPRLMHMQRTHCMRISRNCWVSNISTIYLYCMQILLSIIP